MCKEEHMDRNIKLRKFIANTITKYLNEQHILKENDFSSIENVFQQNPELAQLGSEEQYNKYINSIFPNSKFKHIVYRGDNIKFDLPTNNKIGVYFTANKQTAHRYGPRITTAIIDARNPYQINDSPDYHWKRINDSSGRLYEYDSILYKNGDEIIVSAEQTHILGSKQDIEGFKRFLNSSITESLTENSTELVKREIENASITLGNKIEGGFLNKKQAEDLQREIEANYNDSGIMKFGQDNNDIRQSLFNYDNPLAEKDVNGVNLRIASGLIEGEPYSGKRRKTYLLYADGKIVGKFYSVEDIKLVVKYIEDNLIRKHLK